MFGMPAASRWTCPEVHLQEIVIYMYVLCWYFLTSSSTVNGNIKDWWCNHLHHNIRCNSGGREVQGTAATVSWQQCAPGWQRLERYIKIYIRYALNRCLACKLSRDELVLKFSCRRWLSTCLCYVGAFSHHQAQLMVTRLMMQSSSP